MHIVGAIVHLVVVTLVLGLVVVAVVHVHGQF